MSDKALGNKAAVVVASRFMAGLAQLAAIFALPRLLPKPDVAVLQYLFTVYLTASGLATFGLPQAFLFFVPKLAGPARSAFVRLCFLLLGLFGTVAGAVALVATFWLGGDTSRAALPLVPLIALYIAFDVPVQGMPSYLIALDRARMTAWLNIVFAIVQTTALLLPALLGFPLRVVMFAFVGSAFLRLVVSFIAARAASPSETTGALGEHVKPLLGFSLPLGLSSVTATVNQQIDKYVIEAGFPREAYADYALGAQELPLVSILPYTVATVIMPTLAEKHRTGDLVGLRQTWHASIAKVALVMLPLAVLFFVSAVHLCALAFGTSYLRAADPMRVYLFLLPLRVTSYGVVLQAVGDTRAVLSASLIGAALSAIGSVVAVRWLGFIGPSVAAVVVQVAMAGFLLSRIARRLSVGWSRVFPWLAYARIAALAVALAPVPWFIERALSARHGLALLAGTLGYVAAVWIVGRATSVISAADQRQLAAWLRLRKESSA